MSVETTDASTLLMTTDREFSEPKIRKQEKETMVGWEMSDLNDSYRPP